MTTTSMSPPIRGAAGDIRGVSGGWAAAALRRGFRRLPFSGAPPHELVTVGYSKDANPHRAVCTGRRLLGSRVVLPRRNFCCRGGGGHVVSPEGCPSPVVSLLSTGVMSTAG